MGVNKITAQTMEEVETKKPTKEIAKQRRIR